MTTELALVWTVLALKVLGVIDEPQPLPTGSRR